MERKLGKLFIFASNSESDRALLQEVVLHLEAEAQRAGLSLFHQGQVGAEELLSGCRQHLLAAPVAVVLLSMSLLGDKVSRPLLDEAVARSQSGALRLVPAMASDVDLHETAFEGLQVLFHECPLYRVEHLDEALVKLRQAVRSALHAAQSHAVPSLPAPSATGSRSLAASQSPGAAPGTRREAPLHEVPLDQLSLDRAIRRATQGPDDRLDSFLSMFPGIRDSYNIKDSRDAKLNVLFAYFSGPRALERLRAALVLWAEHLNDK